VHDFRAVYREHFRFVWRSLRRLGLDEHECADSAQQVFIIVHRRLSEFRNDAKITTWLFAICANVVANARRSRGRRNETALDETVVHSTSSPHAQTEARLTIEWLLDQMPHDQRTTFLMFEVEQLTCAEIAQATNTAVGTVKSRLRLARARIASQLGLELPAEESELDDA
jgi:RNA polymerase sigma-70 factor (ECF subfamily)